MKSIMMVVGHKYFQLPPALRTNYVPVLVGKKNFSMENALRDESGINIADKNACYCELTALYWAFWNLDRSYDIVGLCHYRSFFVIPLPRENKYM